MYNPGKPKWWKLYVLEALPCILLFVVSQAHLAVLAERLIEIVLVIVIYAIMALWAFANKAALTAESLKANKERVDDPLGNKPELTEVQIHYLEAVQAAKQQS